MNRRILAFGIFLIQITSSIALAQDQQGQTRTTIFGGTTAFTDGNATSIGSTVGVGWGVTVREQLHFSLSGSSSNTEGNYTTEGATYPINANTLSAQTSLTQFFRTGENNLFIPFAAGGFSVASYAIDFTYPNSTIGRTSGAAPGVFGNFGVEMRMGDHFTLVPQYRVDAMNIRTESGDSVFLRSSGLLFSLKISG